MKRCLKCGNSLGTADVNGVCSECRGHTFYSTSQIVMTPKKTLEALKKPPTVEEVCKALCDFTNWEVKYSTETKQFYHRLENTECTMYITETYGDGLWTLGAYLPPRLITMIGRFYESLEGEK